MWGNASKVTFLISNDIEGNTILSGSNLSIFDAQFTVSQFNGNQSLLLQILEKFIQQDDKTTLIAALKRNEFISESQMQNHAQSLDLSSEKPKELQQTIDNLDYAIAIQLLE